MKKDSFLNDASTISGLKIIRECDFQKHTTLKLREKADLLVLEDTEAAIKVLKLLSSYSLNYKVIGLGSNQVIDPEVDFYIKYNEKFSREMSHYGLLGDGTFWLPSSLPLTIMTQWAIKNEISKWDVISGIPASLGGAVAMNAGTALGEIGSIVQSVRYIDSHSLVIKEHIINHIVDFSYRKNHFLDKNDLILAVKVICPEVLPGQGEKIKKYLDYRAQSQPLWTRNSGCTFKNVKHAEGVKISAGMLLDLMQLKGLRQGDMCVSHKHANFFENLSHASREDVLKLIKQVQLIVLMSTGIELEVEINL
jgi:UDP-N-acetylmuramate dehydrogenase